MTSKTTPLISWRSRRAAAPAALLLFAAVAMAGPSADPSGGLEARSGEPRSVKTEKAPGEGPAPSLERAQSLPGGEASGGLFHLTLTASVAGSVAQGGDFEIRPGLNPGSETSPLIFADGFESGATGAWSSVTP